MHGTRFVVRRGQAITVWPRVAVRPASVSNGTSVTGILDLLPISDLNSNFKDP